MASNSRVELLHKSSHKLKNGSLIIKLQRFSIICKMVDFAFVMRIDIWKFNTLPYPSRHKIHTPSTYAIKNEKSIIKTQLHDTGFAFDSSDINLRCFAVLSALRTFHICSFCSTLLYCHNFNCWIHVEKQTFDVAPIAIRYRVTGAWSRRHRILPFLVYGKV